MAEINDFDDIKDSFNYITEALDSIRAQNAMNAGSMDKVLVHINNSLESLSNEENIDFIKLFLAELKRGLDERHNFVSAKFSEIESSFVDLVRRSESQLQGSEVRELFEIIASNLNNFSKDFSSQKDLIAQVGLQIEEFRQDDSRQKDVLKNISLLKSELEKFGNGFESVILNLNGGFKALSEMIPALDSSESLSGLKKDIDNIFLSSNAVLSTLQVIDHKNKEFDELIKNVVTKEEFKVERDDVARLVAQNLEITDYMNTLPTRDQFNQLTERIDTTVGVINALKNMLNETGKQNQQLLTAQLDNLETKILNISTEEEFIGFRKELSEFAHEVIESSNLMRADLADTNSGIRSLYEFLNTMDIKNSFMNFTKITKTSEDNIKDTIASLSSAVAGEITKNKNMTKSDIDEGVSNVNNNISAAKQEIVETSKKNLSSIVENIQSVISNIFSVKEALHVENLENIETIDNKIQNLKEDLTASSNFIVQNSQENLENIINNVEKVFQEIVAVKGNLGENSSQTDKRVGDGFNQISQKLTQIKNELNQNSQESFANVLSAVEAFSQEISNVKESLEESSQGNSQEVKALVENIYEKLLSLHNNLTKDSELNATEIKGLIEELTGSTQSIRTSLEQISSAGFAGLKSDMEEFSQDLRTMQDNLDIKNQASLAKTVSLFEDLSKEFNIHKEFLSESSQANFEIIALRIQNLSQKFDDTRADLNHNLKEGISELQESISTLPETIKENQMIFENEKKALIEENSRNIEEVGERIQNLVKGVISKDNPFKGEVLYEFAALKVSLTEIKDELVQSNDELSEKVSEQVDRVIESLEGTIAQYNDRYNLALLGLQNKLSESLENIQQSTQESDLKINNSLKETSEIKSEIQSLMRSLSVLREDSTLADLSTDVSERFDGILINITQLEDKVVKGNSASLQSILGTLEEKFEAISEDVRAYKNLTSGTMNEVIEDLGEKTEALKEQLSLISTDVISILSSKTNEMVELLSPIGDSIEKISSVNFEEMASDIKKQISSSYFSVQSMMKEDLKQQNEAQLQKILEDFESLNQKLDESLSKASSDSASEFEELKVFLGEKFENTTLISDALRSVLDKLKELNSISNTTLMATQGMVSEVKEEITEKFSAFEDTLSQSQDETKNAILDGITQAQEETKASILNGLAQLQEETEEKILEGLKENIISIKKEYQNLTQSTQATQESVSEVIEKTTEISRTKVFEKLDAMEDKIFESQDTFKMEILEEIKENIAFIKENYQVSMQPSVSDIIENTVGVSEEKVLDKLETIDSKIFGAQNDFKKVILDEIKENVSFAQESNNLATRSLVSDVVASTVEESRGQVFEKLNIIEEKILEAQDNLKEEILEELKENIAFIKESYELSNKASASGVIESVVEASGEKILEKLEAVENKLFESQGELKTEISGLVENTIETSRDKVFEKFDAIEDRILEAQDNLKSDILGEIKENVNFAQESHNLSIRTLVADVVESTSEESRSQVFEKLSIIEDKILESQDNLREDLLEELKENTAFIKESYKNSTQSLTPDVVESVVEASGEKVFEKLDIIEEKILESQDSLKENLLEEIKENMAFIREGYQGITPSSALEEIESIAEASTEKVLEKLETIESKILDAQDARKTALLDEIIQAQYESKTSLLDELKDSIDFIKDGLSSLSPKDADEEAKNKFNEEVSQKIEALQEDLKTISEEIENKISESEVSYKNSTQSLLSEVKTSFYEKVDDSLDELRSFLEVLEDKKDISLDLDNLKSELLDKFDDISYNLEKSVSSISIKDELQDLNSNFENSLDNLLVNIEEKLATSSENNQAIDDMANKTEEITRRIEELKNVIAEDVAEKLAGFELSRESQQQDFSNSLEEIKTSLAEFKESYTDLSVNSMMELSGFIVTIQDKVEGIQNKLDEFNFDEKFSNFETKIDELNLDEKFNNLQNELSNLDVSENIENSKNEIVKEFETINQKLDLLNLESDSELEEEVKEIKRIVSAQNALLNKLDESFKLKESVKDSAESLLDELSGNLSTSEEEALTSVKSEIQNILEKFEEKLDTLTQSTYISDSGEVSQINIKGELSLLKEELLEGFVEFFNQISFVAEAEDIKDFVEEKSEAIKSEIISKIENISISGGSEGSNIGLGNIKESLKDALGDNFDNILSSLDNNCFNIQSEIKEVKSHLQAVKNSLEDETEYSYTLQDVESDIAKIRLILKENSQPKVESSLSGLDKLNEDIMSISTRTNKLLLNSDESYATLQANLDQLRNVVYQFEKKVKHLDNKESINKIEKRLEGLNKLMLSSVQSDKIFNQTFMYLAEWIDKADENIETIKKTMIKPTDLEKILDKFSKKFDQQQEKIKSLETKIEKLTKTAPVKATKDTDLKTLVREVLSQVERPEFKVDTKLSKKVDGIDRQLATLGKSIEKITSYVDEE